MISEIFRFEKNAYDPQEVIGAVRDCRYFHQDSTHSRPFFGRTVDQLLLNEYPEEVASLVSVIMGGADSAMAGLKAYLLKSSRPPTLKPKKLFNKAEHVDQMPNVLAICYVGAVAVRLRDPTNQDTERIDLHPGDILLFSATRPHSFVPLEPRRSLSIPYVHQ